MKTNFSLVAPYVLCLFT